MVATSALLLCALAADSPYFHGAADSVFTRRNLGIGTMPEARLHVTSGEGLAIILPGLRLIEHAAGPSVIGGAAGNFVGRGVIGAVIAGGGGADRGAVNGAGDHFAVICGGAGNRAGDFSGTPEDGAFATVGGGEGNTAASVWTTVGGGRGNSATNQGATISGGELNSATNIRTTIGGGALNAAGNYGATVGGGVGNVADGRLSVIAGGFNNVTTSTNAAVGGGTENAADGWGSTIPGGVGNSAAGFAAFAAGHRAKAMHDGSFVWADATEADFESTGEHQFLIRAAGGVGIGTSEPQQMLSVNGSAGKPGGGAWAVFSDARLKTAVTPMRGVLDTLLRLHGREFTYTAEAIERGRGRPGRQIGLIAQEVAEVFPDWVEQDADGYLFVTERATTALLVESLRELREEKAREVEALRRDIESLRREQTSLRNENAALAQRVATLERAIRELQRRR